MCGFRKVDKRDPLAKNPRAETRTGCEARLYVKLDEGTGKFVVTDFKEKHNHNLVSPECAHMLPSQRKISATQAIELDLVAQFGLRLGQSFELMGANVERKLIAHFAVENEVSNDDATQSFEVDCEYVNHVVQPKGLKKNVATSKGKRRVKREFETALVVNSKKQSRANSLASSKSIGNNLRKIYIMPNSMLQRYSAQPTFQSILQGTKRWNVEEISVIATETIAQTDAEIIHVDAAKLCCCCCCCCCYLKVMLLLLLKSYVVAIAGGK
ncbi:hypothetical protein ACSBR2_032967 [Camellia fascicularis]